jgi:hypothetical protein
VLAFAQIIVLIVDMLLVRVFWRIESVGIVDALVVDMISCSIRLVSFMGLRVVSLYFATETLNDLISVLFWGVFFAGRISVRSALSGQGQALFKQVLSVGLVA